MINHLILSIISSLFYFKFDSPVSTTEQFSIYKYISYVQPRVNYALSTVFPKSYTNYSSNIIQYVE